VALVEAMELL